MMELEMFNYLRISALLLVLAAGLTACLPGTESENAYPGGENGPATNEPETLPTEAPEDGDSSFTFEPEKKISSPGKKKPPPVKDGSENNVPNPPDLAGVFNQAIVEQAITKASENSGLPVESFQVVEASAREWPDSSLGCPQPGMMYLQVISEGYQVVLKAEGKLYDYHAGRSGQFKLCENASP
jgi:hypothetical protein